MAARRAHNPEVTGSSPVPARETETDLDISGSVFYLGWDICGSVITILLFELHFFGRYRFSIIYVPFPNNLLRYLKQEIILPCTTQGRVLLYREKDMAMALKEEELQVIGEYVQNHLAEWLPEQTHSPAAFNYPLELTERMIRVEEELKNQRELMKQGFEQIDKRFEQIDRRFEQMQLNMDKRFELMHNSMDKRSEQAEKRFELMQNSTDNRFESMQISMEKGFEKVNASIEALSTKMFYFMIWSFGFTATVAGIVIAVIKFM